MRKQQEEGRENKYPVLLKYIIQNTQLQGREGG